MAIVKAQDSFVVVVAGTRHEVHEGDLLSNSHPIVEANPRRFGPGSEDDLRVANERARGRS